MNDDPAAPKKKSSKGGLIALLLIVLGVAALCTPLCLAGAGKSVSSDTVLELDLDQSLDESGGGPLAIVSSDHHDLVDVVLALEKAKTDAKVKGLLVRVGAAMPMATAQEIRDAVLSFKKSGKPAVAYSEGFGEMSPGVSAYVVASAFDEIWLQPSGDVGMTGLFGEAVFLRGAFDKLGIEPQFSGRKEFKNAVNMFTESTFTLAHKEAEVSMLQSLEDQIVDDIATARPKLGTKEHVRALLEGGPLSSSQALEMNLVDKLGYKDEVLASLDQRFGKAKRLWVGRYIERAGEAFKDEGKGAVVALITAKGSVTRGKNGVDPLGGGESFGSDTISAAVRAAAADDDVKVILLRVDSPGGSYVAADTIWRAIEEAKKKGKKVVASMGDLAASGGYFISMGADKVIAEPATLTGSIGVFSGRFYAKQLMDKLGVNVEAALADDNVDPSYYSSTVEYSAKAKQNLEATLDRIYGDFTTKAAQGRHMSVDKLEPLAHGRVWTGAQAKERGLVDDNGGFMKAVDAARALAGVGADGAVRLRRFPKEKKPVEELIALVKGESGDNSDDVSANIAVRSPEVVAKLRAALRGVDAQSAGVLSAPIGGAP
jgi:protease-4